MPAGAIKSEQVLSALLVTPMRGKFLSHLSVHNKKPACECENICSLEAAMAEKNHYQLFLFTFTHTYTNSSSSRESKVVWVHTVESCLTSSYESMHFFAGGMQLYNGKIYF